MRIYVMRTVLVFVCVPGCVGTILWLGWHPAKPSVLPTAAAGHSLFIAPVKSKELRMPTFVPVAAPEQRMLIANARGFAVVVDATGATYLEDAAGKRTLLAQQEQPTLPIKLPLQPTSVANKPGTGQIVVLDSGLIEIPKDSMLVFIGKDYAVTRRVDGITLVYHADGRVEQRRRPTLADKRD